MDSFTQLMEIPEKPKNRKEESEFTQVLTDIYQRHNPTMVSVARGMIELKEELKQTMCSGDVSEFPDCGNQLKQSLDAFYLNRIGIRTVCYIFHNTSDIVR